MERWGIEMLEYWVKKHFFSLPIIPFFHYSIIPVFPSIIPFFYYRPLRMLLDMTNLMISEVPS